MNNRSKYKEVFNAITPSETSIHILKERIHESGKYDGVCLDMVWIMVMMFVVTFIKFYCKNFIDRNIYMALISFSLFFSIVLFLRFISKYTNSRSIKLLGPVGFCIFIFLSGNTIIFADDIREEIEKRIQQARPDEWTEKSSVEDYQCTYEEAKIRADQYFEPYSEDDVFIRDKKFGGWMVFPKNSDSCSYTYDLNTDETLEIVCPATSEDAMTLEEAKETMIKEWMNGEWATYPEG